jgi:DNA-binding NarL/FixJ family response regulator
MTAVTMQSSADVVDLESRVPRRRARKHTARPIRVVVADPVRLVRAGFRALLEGGTDIEVAGEAASGEEVVAVASETQPDVVLMDVCLPGLEAPEATRRIVGGAELSEVHVLMVGGRELNPELLACLRAGASGCLLRDTDPGELVRSVQAVAAGEPVLPRSVVRRVLAGLTSQPETRLPRPDELDELTAREREVMALVATGLSNAELAEHLVVSHATAKTHVSRALRKLHARDRAQLVTLAYETGLVLPGQPAAARLDAVWKERSLGRRQARWRR